MTIAGILLAAGRSERMGGVNKLLAPWGSGFVVEAVWKTMLGAGLERIVVVAGFEAPRVQAVLPGATVVRNARFEEGLGTSIAAGVEAAGAAEGYLIVLGDMPRVPPDHLRALVAERSEETTIVASRTEGRLGPPVLFGGAYRGELGALSGDEGARVLLHRHADQVRAVDLAPSEAADIDHPQDLV
ncbi:MAG: nucleotidyltransferase family protein [Fimbriimonadaceae bacterium]|nr:nucleotidyltransferase family protein [Fimbriimonadaceae bacterium]